MAFSDSQIGALESRLRASHVCEREEDGRVVFYIEGWHVIDEANRIFGFDAWDRKLIRSECVWQGRDRNLQAASYVATARIRVRAGDQATMRDGTGYGYGTGPVPGAAHEKAAKEAETDATKRALVTFGNPFGLALYDPQQRGVTRRRRPSTKPAIWTLRSGSGQAIARHKDPVAFTKELLQLIQLAASPKALVAISCESSISSASIFEASSRASVLAFIATVNRAWCLARAFLSLSSSSLSWRRIRLSCRPMLLRMPISWSFYRTVTPLSAPRYLVGDPLHQ